ncbi:hypothetical protein CCAX7_60070 [Capsulimonas corticalis]|uniref:Uncharacterized protein n=1 Tax=Capsulimonas corticalis TaxID=2219043 RepID=A0A9N7QAR9_9BACT|nr:hypothetical protein CCAX7_26260 [Capsulimonas corticalis]BDI33956.1 hypothetical protein CCAX7_60070 [Capsulimonas corticalis]
MVKKDACEIFVLQNLTRACNGVGFDHIHFNSVHMGGLSQRIYDGMAILSIVVYNKDSMAFMHINTDFLRLA